MPKIKLKVTSKYDPTRDLRIRNLADQVVEVAKEVLLERKGSEAYSRVELKERLVDVIDRAVARLR